MFLGGGEYIVDRGKVLEFGFLFVYMLFVFI